MVPIYLGGPGAQEETVNLIKTQKPCDFPEHLTLCQLGVPCHTMLPHLFHTHFLSLYSFDLGRQFGLA